MVEAEAGMRVKGGCDGADGAEGAGGDDKGGAAGATAGDFCGELACVFVRFALSGLRSAPDPFMARFVPVHIVELYSTLLARRLTFLRETDDMNRVGRTNGEPRRLYRTCSNL